MRRRQGQTGHFTRHIRVILPPLNDLRRLAPDAIHFLNRCRSSLQHPGRTAARFHEPACPHRTDLREHVQSDEGVRFVHVGTASWDGEHSMARPSARDSAGP